MYDKPHLGDLATRLGIEAIGVSGERTELRMPVEGNTQPAGLLHGGASAALAETAGSLAAQEHAGSGRAAVGIELSISHHRPATRGFVTAIAEPVHLGKTLATYAISISDEAGRLVATSRLTCMIVDARPRP